MRLLWSCISISGLNQISSVREPNKYGSRAEFIVQKNSISNHHLFNP